MTTSKKWFAVLAVAVLTVASFLFGFDVCLHLKTSSSNDLRRMYLRQPGDAPPRVRAAVLASLRAFQDGYASHDSTRLNPFMERLFPKNADVVLLGTDAGELIRGYSPVADFIRADWEKWGRFTFDVENSTVSSVGDVAWISSFGTVRFSRSERPVRFSAVLTRSGETWVFRHIQWQWEERDPATVDLWRPATHARIAQLLLDQTSRAARSLTSSSNTLAHE